MKAADVPVDLSPIQKRMWRKELLGYRLDPDEEKLGGEVRFCTLGEAKKRAALSAELRDGSDQSVESLIFSARVVGCIHAGVLPEGRFLPDGIGWSSFDRVGSRCWMIQLEGGIFA